MKALEGKNAYITGASRGIGKGIALEFARQGANVAITDLRESDLTPELIAEFEAFGVKCIAIACDASNFAATQEAIDKTVAAFGTIDILVNNAGITMDTLLLRMTEEQFDTVLRVNLKSAFNSTKAVLKPMLKQRSGSIINISSIVGVTGNAGQANYAASKAGMIAFTQSTAKELGSRSIRANAVAPGFIATEMTQHLPEAELTKWMESIPLKRAGSVQDIADLCVFLGSDQSTYITGQTLHVNGGMYM
jgi:3-oxoacyl-[acyl-carrier protein] reductase